ncbi:helix-turn-helix domain-containing protein [Synechococcus sp. C9]|jgi:DNA-binding transcriptional MerR regulator|uniref:helix-turn-helix domain-containing protein n=1 Tax=Synechococcus sp. C9 TaxID=102119 RepID=UPI001FF48D32|nr:helix-turn-helix domain-containing protein [Synechococcus sp. C9]
MFFSTKEAARITGCTIRQLQYWRSKGLVVPVVNPAGTGYSAYYDRENLVNLSIVHYLLQRGYDLAAIAMSLAVLQKLDAGYAQPEQARRFLLRWEDVQQKLVVEEFDPQKVAVLIKQGVFSMTVIPVDELQRQIQTTIENPQSVEELVMAKLMTAGWDKSPHSITINGEIVAKNKSSSTRSGRKNRAKADYILNYGHHGAIAVVEAKSVYMDAGDGLQQAKNYAEMLELQFAYSTNGIGIVEYDFGTKMIKERDAFPTPDELWKRLGGISNTN